MNIFIAGATGVLGRRVVKQCIDTGHSVVGLCRSDENRHTLKFLGAEPREGDLFDVGSLWDAVQGCDVVMHLATAIPKKTIVKKRDWELNDQIRVDATKNLIEVALAHKCRHYLQQSVTFLYGNNGDEWIDESASVPKKQFSFLQSACEMESIVIDRTENGGLPSVILRLGWMYSTDAYHITSLIDLMKSRIYKGIGIEDQYWSLIHADDAAAACVKAIGPNNLNHGSIYNVVDDEPVRIGELINYIAETLGIQKPGRTPVFLAKAFLGSEVVDSLMVSARIKNDAAKKDLRWEPIYKTFREGYTAVIKDLKHS